MSGDMTERLFESHEKRVAAGAQRYLEQKRKAEVQFGFGGVQLSRQEKADLYREMALDPMGQRMAEVLANRQRANKLAANQIPRDFVDFDVSSYAKLLEEQASLPAIYSPEWTKRLEGEEQTP